MCSGGAGTQNGPPCFQGRAAFVGFIMQSVGGAVPTRVKPFTTFDKEQGAVHATISVALTAISGDSRRTKKRRRRKHWPGRKHCWPILLCGLALPGPVSPSQRSDWVRLAHRHTASRLSRSPLARRSDDMPTSARVKLRICGVEGLAGYLPDRRKAFIDLQRSSCYLRAAPSLRRMRDRSVRAAI